MSVLHSGRSFLRLCLVSFLLFSVTFAAGLAPGASAAPATEELVTESRFTVERFLADPGDMPFKSYLERARGVLIIPQLIKGGLILGAEGGSGVLLVRGHDGQWSAPAFYTIAGGSIGLQLGGQISEMVLTVMTDEAVAALLADEVKFGAEVSVAMGPKGAGIEAASSTDFSADIYAFSKAAGLFGGGSLSGSKLFERVSLNTEYYGGKPSSRDIVIDRRFSNPQSDRLRHALSE